MIYLIDDTPIQELNKCLDITEFNNYIIRIADLQIEDLIVQSDIECVLIHESFHDNAVFEYVKTKLCKLGKAIPLVVFSDGHFSQSKMGGSSYVASLKKSLFYSRLKRFLVSYKESGLINLKILAESETTTTTQRSNSLEDLLKNLDIKFPGNEGVAINDTSSIIYCLGRGGMRDIAGSVHGEYVKFDSHIAEDANGKFSHKRLHDFITATFTKKIKALYLDVDADPALCMCLAMHVRLTYSLVEKSHLCPIIFISDYNLNNLIKKSEYAQIFMTEGVVLSKRGEALSYTDMQQLSEDAYQEHFLDRIVIPAPKGSNHSIANQWGASRLYSILTGHEIQKRDYAVFSDVNKELYYKYIRQKLSISNSFKTIGIENFKVNDAIGKKVLLIDDQADQGWRKTIESLLPMSRIEVISERVMDYMEFSDDAKELIEKNEWDLFLLDLRLGGTREDGEVDTKKMSGYKVLSKIKELNRGNQVIILTASNKAWNLKALLQSEIAADGYFVKESPEYEFPDELSIANLLSLKSDIEKCFERTYLKQIWKLIERLSSTPINSFKSTLLAQLKIAYNMAARADSADEYQFAYIALNQIWEIISGSHNLIECISGDTNNRAYELMYVDQYRKYNDIDQEHALPIIYKTLPFAIYKRPSKPSVKEKMAIICLQKWNMSDNGIIYLLGELIKVRNCLIHIDNTFISNQAIKENSIYNHKYLGNTNLIYRNEALRKIYSECAKQNLLYEDSNHLFLLHKEIASSSIGIRMQVYCIDYLFEKIINS